MRGRSVTTIVVVGAWIGGGLWAESRVDASGQLLLGVLTVGVLAGMLALQTPAVRTQALLVMAVASTAEVAGSLVWGVYSYRFENLPLFVPPGHALVYLAGVGLAGAVGRHRLLLVGAASVSALGWGVLGLTALPRLDVSGAIGCALLGAVLLTTRRPVYAGVFFVVAALELYGTALGTWTWATTVPGIGIPQGNPPSGVASGYVLFDVAALTAAARWSTCQRAAHLLGQRLRAAVVPHLDDRVAARDRDLVLVDDVPGERDRRGADPFDAKPHLDLVLEHEHAPELGFDVAARPVAVATAEQPQRAVERRLGRLGPPERGREVNPAAGVGVDPGDAEALRVRRRHASSSSTRWAIANAEFAAGTPQ